VNERMNVTVGTADLQPRVRLGAGIAAGALIGFGLILWIAANWDDLGKVTKFALVGGTLLAGALAAMLRPALRIPGTLISFAATGGLFALFGQTYQSGADPWQLFALWAVLGLPLALAARHDAVFVPWTMVAFTAVSLWLETGHRAWTSPLLQWVLVAWAMVGATLLLLSLVNRMNRPEEPAVWAFRLAILAGTAFIATNGIQSILAHLGPGPVYWLALVVLIASAWRLALATPLQPTVLAGVALGIDALLIAGCVKVYLFHGNGGIGNVLLFAISTAIIMGLTATILLKWLRRRAGDTANPATDEPAAESTPWAVAALSGLGALITAAALLVFLFLFFSEAMRHGPTAYGLAAIGGFGAVAALRKTKSLSFLQQLAFIGLVAALALFSVALMRDLPARSELVAAILLALSVALAFAIPLSWVRSLLGVAGAFLLVGLIRTVLYGNMLHAILGKDIHSAAIAAIVAALLLWFSRNRPGDDNLISAYASGFAPGTLLVLANTSGPTFLLHSSSGFLEGMKAGNLSMVAILTPVASVVATLLGAGLVLRWRPTLKTPLVLAIGAATAALSLLSTLLGYAVLILGMALATGRRTIALAAAVAGLWIIGSLYHSLHWPLDRKGMALIALGLALALVLLLTRQTQGAGAALPRPAALRGTLASGLIALSTLATSGVFGLGVREKEAILSTGQTIYIALMPVDPRSLMQGDYMALRFFLPSGQDDTRILASASHPVGVMTIGANNIGRVTRIAAEAGSTDAPGERFVKLRRANGGWSLGTNAWFFREGQGKKFEAAKYGEFRLGPKGDLLLVAMADEHLKRID